MPTPAPKSAPAVVSVLRAVKRGTRATGQRPSTQTVDTPREGT